MRILLRCVGLWSVIVLLMGLVSTAWANACFEPYSKESIPLFSGDVPETFEEMLQVFKDFMQDSDGDGHVLAERISGTPRQAWRFLVEREDRVRVFEVPFSPHYPRPYLTCSFDVYFNEQGKLTELGIITLENSEQLALPDRITPKRVRHVLGEPNRLVALSASDMGRPKYTIEYSYHIKNYYLVIYFSSKELVGDFRAKNLEEEKRFREYLHDYQVHKNIRATSMIFGD